MAATLPKSMVIKSNYFNDKGYFHYKDDGSVALGEESVFSTRVKVEMERATSNDKYVHFRFSYSNKYWHRKADGSWFIAAESSKPEEDTTKLSCTLFEPIQVEDDPNLFYLIHVQSGGRLLIDNATMVFYVEFNPKSYQGYLGFVDWDALVKLPAHVAFKGDNTKYLKAFRFGTNYLQFSSENRNEVFSRHTVSLMPDGHVRITSDHWGMLWRRGQNDWILGDSADQNDVGTLFWPVKIDDSTIALQNVSNGKFCSRRLTNTIITGSLNAEASTPTAREAGLQVEELMTTRKVYNVRYQMENARIFDEAPYSAWSSTLVNDGDEDAAMAVAITYQDSRAYTFGRSFTFMAGVPTTIQAGVPFIDKPASIAVSSYEISAPLQWNTATTITTTVTATGAVPVPARSTAVVSYVGTKGTCNVPYYYTQLDQSSAPSGQITETEHLDGIYTGVNCYNFNFVVEKTTPL